MVRSLRPLPAALILVITGLAACGSGPGRSAGGPDGHGPRVHPTGARQVVFEVRYEGGFAPSPPPAQAALPAVLITGDGRIIDGAPVPAIYPGPLVPPLQQRPVAEADIQRLLARADRDGLLAEVTYRDPTGIADARTVVVTIAAGGRTYEHRAHALGDVPTGDGHETDPARARLADFVGALLDVQRWRPDATAERPYESAGYLLRAWPAVDTTVPGGGAVPAPAVVAWPAGAPVRFAAADRCTAVPAAPLHALLTRANQLTRFADGGVVYQLAVTPQLPGHTC